MKRCANCYYYIPLEGVSEGFCHREPPVVGAKPDGQLTSTFAPVSEIMWCGEWSWDIGKWWRDFKWEPARTG